MRKWQHWFPFDSFRPYQEDTLCRIVEAFEKKRFVILQAVCGSGKSATAMGLGKHLAPCYVATVEKQLQDQYNNDFSKEGLVVLKGKSNYGCTKEWDIGYGETAKHTCESAPCGLNVSTKAAKIISTECRDNELCPYINAKNFAFMSDLALLNFSNLLAFSSLSEGGIPKKKLLIIDEAHQLEGQLYNFAEVTFSPRTYQGILLSDDDLELLKEGFKSLDQAINFCERITPQLEEHHALVSSDAKADNKTLRRAEELLKQAQKKRRLMDSLKKGKEFVFKPTQDGQGCILSPLTVDHLHNLAFSTGEKVLLMSATILDPKVFAKSLGIKDYTYIEVPSTFPQKNRMAISIPVGSMSFKNIDATFPQMVEFTKKIVNKHHSEKGIIQTYNYRIAEMYRDALADHPQYHRFLFHTRDSNKNQLVEEHFRDPKEPTILVGPGFKEGLDFKDWKARFQILAKMPCPDLKNPVISKRSKIEPAWYALMVAMAIIQMLGRTTRSETDKSVNYILDSYFRSFYYQNQHLFSKDLQQTIHMVEYKG